MAWFKKKPSKKSPSFRELHAEVLNRVSPDVGTKVKRGSFVMGHSPLLNVPSAQELPLQVVLSGTTQLRRPRTFTRVGDESPSLLQNWLEVVAPIDAQSVLSAGVAALELGVSVLRAQAPRGKTGMEELRLLRAASHRFQLGLVLRAESDEEALEVAHWCHALELPFPDASFQKEFLRQLEEMERVLILRRTEGLDARSFLAGVEYLRESYRRPIIGVEQVVRDAYGRYSVDHAALALMAQEMPVILDLKSASSTSGEQESNGLAGIGSGIQGVVLTVDTFDELSLSETFATDAALLKKLDAMRYTMNALRHLS